MSKYRTEIQILLFAVLLIILSDSCFAKGFCRSYIQQLAAGAECLYGGPVVKMTYQEFSVAPRQLRQNEFLNVKISGAEYLQVLNDRLVHYKKARRAANIYGQSVWRVRSYSSLPDILPFTMEVKLEKFGEGATPDRQYFESKVFEGTDKQKLTHWWDPAADFAGVRSHKARVWVPAERVNRDLAADVEAFRGIVTPFAGMVGLVVSAATLYEPRMFPLPVITLGPVGVSLFTYLLHQTQMIISADRDQILASGSDGLPDFAALDQMRAAIRGKVGGSDNSHAEETRELSNHWQKESAWIPPDPNLGAPDELDYKVHDGIWWRQRGGHPDDARKVMERLNSTMWWL